MARMSELRVYTGFVKDTKLISEKRLLVHILIVDVTFLSVANLTCLCLCLFDPVDNHVMSVSCPLSQYVLTHTDSQMVDA